MLRQSPGVDVRMKPSRRIALGRQQERAPCRTSPQNRGVSAYPWAFEHAEVVAGADLPPQRQRVIRERNDHDLRLSARRYLAGGGAQDRGTCLLRRSRSRRGTRSPRGRRAAATARAARRTWARPARSPSTRGTGPDRPGCGCPRARGRLGVPEVRGDVDDHRVVPGGNEVVLLRSLGSVGLLALSPRRVETVWYAGAAEYCRGHA
jgi:hypothetical protein